VVLTGSYKPHLEKETPPIRAAFFCPGLDWDNRAAQLLCRARLKQSHRS